MVYHCLSMLLRARAAREPTRAKEGIGWLGNDLCLIKFGSCGHMHVG